MPPVTVRTSPRSSTPRKPTCCGATSRNLDGPVFALVNLPEVVKGALFARYSRSPKSLRRLFLDEFVGDLDISGDHTIDATVGLRRAEDLYEKVFVEYGDDSVAQLGGVHLACEQASNVLTKVLEWGRLMSYLEQSTRYIAYDARLGGRYRFYRDPAVLASRLGTRYVGDMDRLFDAYSHVLAAVTEHVRATVARHPDDSDFVFRQATRAKALDAVRGHPAGGVAVQRRHLRQRPGVRGAAAAHAGPPAARGPGLRRPDAARAAQGHPQLPAPRRRRRARRCAGATTSPTTRERTAELVESLFAEHRRRDARRRSRSSTSIPTPRTSCWRRSATRTPTCPSTSCSTRVGRLGADERLALVRAYVGERENRRHKPGRAFERVDYRFDVLSDYGAFRDLQRHRLLTIEWQRADAATTATCAPSSSTTPGRPAVRRGDAPLGRPLRRARATTSPSRRPYAVSMAYRLRYVMQFNARGGDPPARAALGRPGPPGVPADRARDAPADRRAGRPPRRRRGDDPPDDRGARARAPRSRAAGRGPPQRRHVTVVTITVRQPGTDVRLGSGRVTADGGATRTTTGEKAHDGC